MADLIPFADVPLPALVDGNGRPLRQARDVLTREIAAPSMASIRNITSGHPAQGLTPQRLASLLRQSEEGDATAYLELAEEMEEKDLHYLSVMGTRKRAVSQEPVTVKSASDDPEDEADAQLLRDWLDRLTLQGELFDIMDAAGKGYSATEIIWGMGEQWLPDRLEWQDPRFFEYDRGTGRKLLLRGGLSGMSGLPLPLPEHKFIIHQAPAKSGLPIRGGLARAAAWGYLFKNYATKDWLAFMEVYGLPLRVGKYAPGTAESDIAILERAVAQIGQDAGAVIPQSMLIEFVQAGGAAANPEMFERKCKYIDEQLSKAVLGQTSSSDAKSGGLGSGQADLHGEVRRDIKSADCAQLSATLTHDLGRPMVMFNRGIRKRYPLIIVGAPDPVDLKQALDGIEAAMRNSVPVSVSYFRNVTAIPEPRPGEEVLLRTPENPATEDGGAPGGADPAKSPAIDLLAPLKTRPGASPKLRVAASVTPAPGDAIDDAAAEALHDWERLAAPIINPIAELAASSTSLEDFRDRLASSMTGTGTDAMIDMLAQACFGARLQGSAAIEQEQAD
ncbi:MAG TPA: DUF935 domain-containing protein [Sphingobium sp.]